MISSLINKSCSNYQAIELIFQKTGDCMKRFFILLPFAFFSFFAFAQTKLELYKDMVTTDNLRLRTPYAENKIITVLNKGTGVKIIGIEDETEAITEEYDGSYRNRWVRITVDGKTGWISGAYLSAERGGPTYYIPEDWIAFLKGDAP